MPSPIISIEGVRKTFPGGRALSDVRFELFPGEVHALMGESRGIDVGAKAEIHKLLRRLADQGRAIVMVSSELPEILCMSARIVVMCEGRITRELTAREATQERIMQLATQRETTTQRETMAA